MTLDEFMQSEDYVKYLDELDKVLPEKIDRTSRIDEVVIEIENDSLQYASVKPEELAELIKKDNGKTISYIMEKHEKFFEPDGGEDNITNKPPQLNYPVGHLIEYYLLSNKAESLLDYIRSVGIPNAKKYVSDLMRIYTQVQQGD